MRNKIKKLLKIGLSVTASLVCMVSLFSGLKAIKAETTPLTVETPYGIVLDKSYKWTIGLGAINTAGLDMDVYARYTLNGEKVYCVEPLVQANDGTTNYIGKDASAYFGNTEKAKEIGYITSLGYGFNGDRSDEMDFATQIRIWQELKGQDFITHIHPDIQAKINQINERLNVLYSDVSFNNEKVTLYGYGKEYAKTLTDETGVFNNYSLRKNTGIHAEQNGNSLTVWAEKGDKLKSALQFSVYGLSANGSSIVYDSPTSQDMGRMRYSDPVETKLSIQVITGAVKVNKLDNVTKTQAQGLAKLDKAVYDLYRQDTNEKVGTLTWTPDKGSNEIDGLVTRLPDGETPVKYVLKEVQSPTGYHSGLFEDGILNGSVPVVFDLNSVGDDGVVRLTVAGEDRVSEVQLNKVDSNNNPVKGATLQLLDAETNKKVKFNYNEEEADDKKVWVTDGNPLTVKGLKIGHEYILQEVHAPNGVKLADDVHFVVDENTEVQIVKMVDETKPTEPPVEPKEPSISTTALIDGKKKIEPKGVVELVDKVKFDNFEVGKTYVFNGSIVDKATGEKLEDLTATKEITTDAENGLVELTFKVDSDKLAGKDLVVFEKVLDKETGKEIAKHEDIKDEGQTVTIEQKPEEPKEEVHTGVNNNTSLLAGLGLMSVLGLVVLGIKRYGKGQ